MFQMEKAAAKLFPETEADREAILSQLDRMVAHPLFCNSKRYPGLLRYLVEHALVGDVDQLKERTLGIEVFHRPAAYDTNLDPVVRITAGEIRKRIAQYYFQPDRESEIRIDLRPGSYVPEFYLPTHTPLAPPALSTEQGLVSLPPAPPAPAVRSRWKWAPVLALLMLVSVTIVWQKPWARRSVLNQFWEPVISSPGSTLVCISDQMDSPGPGNQESGQNPLQESQIPMHMFNRSMHRVGLDDAITLARVATVLSSMGKKYVVRGDKSTTLEDLRQGPVVLVGAFDNDWTLRLTKDLRFTFEAGQPHARIKDRLNPNRNLWTVDGDAPYLKITEDYAVISRFRDQTSGSTVVVAAGLGVYGTLAAGEMLSNEFYLQQLVSHAPRDWAKMNLEAVISTQVINGNSGPPRVLETHFW